MTCLFTTCHRPSATHSRAGACAMHEAELEREAEKLRRRTGHECPEHPRVERELWDESDE